MLLPQGKSSVVVPLLAVLGCLTLFPQPSHAIPAFARKFNVKCYNCHTIPPALNKTGYMFKRLGYRLPPDEMDGTKAAPKIRDLDDPEARFSLTNSVALVTQGSFAVDKTGGAAPSSTSSFNLDKAAIFGAGVVPQTNFSYFAEFNFFEDGNSSLEQAQMIYTAGRANSSFFARAGEMHMQEGEGTRAAMLYNLFPEPSLILRNTDALNFSLDQHPVGAAAGYTWASPYYKQIFAITGKVTNGLNADGSEILGTSTKNSKDVWLDADWWFGPDGGISFMTYSGRKDQTQNPGTADEFTFRPAVRRYGIFGNYLFFDKLDVLGGYMRGNDDWRDGLDGPVAKYTSNGYRAEVDYYLKRGFALMGRYDRLGETVAGGPATHTEEWGVGGVKALTELGNVIVRATYNHERITDPVSGDVVPDKLFKIDVRLMW